MAAIGRYWEAKLHASITLIGMPDHHFLSISAQLSSAQYNLTIYSWQYV